MRCRKNASTRRLSNREILPHGISGHKPAAVTQFSNVGDARRNGKIVLVWGHVSCD